MLTNTTHSLTNIYLAKRKPSPRVCVRWGFAGYPDKCEEFGLIAYGGQMAHRGVLSFAVILPNGKARGV